jgi:hypothetical protein
MESPNPPPELYIKIFFKFTVMRPNVLDHKQC